MAINLSDLRARRIRRVPRASASIAAYRIGDGGGLVRIVVISSGGGSDRVPDLQEVARSSALSASAWEAWMATNQTTIEVNEQACSVGPISAMRLPFPPSRTNPYAGYRQQAAPPARCHAAAALSAPGASISQSGMRPRFATGARIEQKLAEFCVIGGLSARPAASSWPPGSVSQKAMSSGLMFAKTARRKPCWELPLASEIAHASKSSQATFRGRQVVPGASAVHVSRRVSQVRTPRQIAAVQPPARCQSAMSAALQPYGQRRPRAGGALTACVVPHCRRGSD